MTVSTPNVIAYFHAPFDHVFLIVMENAGYSDLSGDTTNAPYINNTLIPAGFSLTNFKSLNFAGNSLNSYLTLWGGSDFGVIDDLNPPSHEQAASVLTLADPLERFGYDWRWYCQSYPNSGSVVDGDSAPYVEHHVAPFYFDSVRLNTARATKILDTVKLAASGDFSTTSAALTPAFAVIVPDNSHNMHDPAGNPATAAAKSAGDTYLSTLIPMIQASKAWLTQRCCIVVTWDEDSSNGSGSEAIMCIFLGSSLSKVGINKTSATAYNLNNLTATLEWMLGVGNLSRNETGVALITEPFA